MSQYIFIIVWIGLVALFAKMKNFRRTEIVCGQVARRYAPWFAFMVFIPIIFAATPLMLKKKYVSVILIILLASMMHRSALIMIPFVFIAQGEAWNRKTMFFYLEPCL